jgi:very-short-patch-repair endonuclease
MPPSVDVTVTGERARRSRPGLTIHETRTPPPTHYVDGLPLTAPLRTLQDLNASEVSAAKRSQVNQTLGPYVVDFLWPDQRVIVETDGFRTHGHRAAFENDRARDADLHARGYVVLRFTWRQIVDEPLLVAARLAGALSLRSLLRPGRAAA